MSSREKLKRKLYTLTNNDFQDDNYIADKLNNIENVIKNIDSYFDDNDFNSVGGSKKKNNNNNNTLSVKYKKIKIFAKTAKNTIKKYKKVAQNYFNYYKIIFANYIILLDMLTKQKNFLIERQREHEKLSKDYSNGVDKIKLLETMINNIEKVVKKTTNLDLEIKNKINNNEFNVKANAKISRSNKNSIELIDKNFILPITQKGGSNLMYGGESMDFYDFETQLNKEIDELARSASDLEADNKFINEKINLLHTKVGQIMSDTEDLFNIRLSIEWLVNELENNIAKTADSALGEGKEEAIDYRPLYEKLQATINDVKSKQKSPEIAKYLRELEGMAIYLEEFIKSSKDTLNAIPEEKRTSMLKTLTDIHGVTKNYLEDNKDVKEVQENQENKKDVFYPPPNPKAYFTSLFGSNQRADPDQKGGLKRRYLLGSVPLIDSYLVSKVGLKRRYQIGSGPLIDAYNNINITINTKILSLIEQLKTKNIYFVSVDEGNIKYFNMDTLFELNNEQINETPVIEEVSETPPLESNENPEVSTSLPNVERKFNSTLEYYNSQDKLYQILEMAIQLSKLFELSNNYLVKSRNIVINYNVYWNNLFSKKNPEFNAKIKESEIINLLDLNDVEQITDSDSFEKSNIVTESFLEKLYEVYKNIPNNEVVPPVKTSTFTLFGNNKQETNKNQEANTTSFKLIIKYSIDDLDAVIKLLNSTLIFYYYLTYLLFYRNFFYASIENKNSKNSKNKLIFESNDIKLGIEIFNNLTKSKKLYHIKEFKEFIGTSDVNVLIENYIKNNAYLTKIYELLIKYEKQITTDTDYNKLDDLFEKFSTSYIYVLEKKENINKAFIESVFENIGKNLIKQDRQLTKGMKNLFEMIASKLGEKIPDVPRVDENELNNTTPEKLLGILTNDTKNQKGGEIISRPRVDPFKNALKNCLELLTPLYKKATLVDRWLEVKATPEKENGEKTKFYSDLYSKLSKIMADGTNAYINVNPMIFFTIEFPPAAYKDDVCIFTFTYDSKKQLIYYNPPIDQKCEKNKNKIVDLHTNQAFLKSTNNDTTEDLMTDSVIGLNKLIKSKPNLDSKIPSPTQKVINLMFALGASGTGKTTRYFGFNNSTEKKDHEGIVPGIINEAKQNSASDTKIEISMSYFVSYGRKKDITKIDDNTFDEILIFANIDEVNKKMINYDGSDDKFDNNDFYIFKQVIENVNNNGYSDLYTNLVTRKLQKLIFQSVIDNIREGTEFPTDQSQFDKGYDQCTFRNIIDPKIKKDSSNEGVHEDGNEEAKKETKNDYSNIWFNVSNVTGNDMSNIFENLIKAQKCLRTVLPTKNNIESSRGHTCVLIRIKETKNNITETKYFPLFDMAGTENVDAMTEFFTKNKTPDKMNNLIAIISELSKNNDIKDNEPTRKKFDSLNGLLENKSIQKYVGFKSAQKGGRPFYNIDENNKGVDNLKAQYVKDVNIINKILGEGYYINHTIGMLIYIAKCVGCSINSEKKDNKDMFDQIQPNVLKELSNFIYYYDKTIKDSNGELIENTGSRTRVLYNNLEFKNLLNSSTIWIQILFSFLYWNSENDKTFINIKDNCLEKKNVVETNKSLLLQFGTKSDEVDDNNNGKYLYELLNKLNDSNENPSKNIIYEMYDKNKDKNTSFYDFFNMLYEKNIKKIDVNTDELNKKIKAVKDGLGIKDTEFTLKKTGVDEFKISSISFEKYANYYEISQKNPYDEYKNLNNINFYKLLNYEFEKNVKKNIDLGVSVPDFIITNFNLDCKKAILGGNVCSIDFIKMIDVLKYTKDRIIEIDIKIKENEKKIKDSEEIKRDNLVPLQLFNLTPEQIKKRTLYEKAESEISSLNDNNNTLNTELESLKKLKETFVKKMEDTFNNFFTEENCFKLIVKGKYKTNDVEINKFIDILSLSENRFINVFKELYDFDGNNKTNAANFIKSKTNFNGIDLKIANSFGFESFNKNTILTNKVLKDLCDVFSLNELQYKESKFYFTDGKKSLNEVIDDYNNLLGCYDSVKTNDPIDTTIVRNQIERIKDASIAATKMVLMHVVTGQDYKNGMVLETIGLTNTLYDSTQINLKENTTVKSP